MKREDRLSPRARRAACYEYGSLCGFWAGRSRVTAVTPQNFFSRCRGSAHVDAIDASGARQPRKAR
eukprot:scaffold51927_cov48-Phaeocystis_antarctica.AAC.2